MVEFFKRLNYQPSKKSEFVSLGINLVHFLQPCEGGPSLRGQKYQNGRYAPEQYRGDSSRLYKSDYKGYFSTGAQQLLEDSGGDKD
jgi:hypothetical protein